MSQPSVFDDLSTSRTLTALTNFSFWIELTKSSVLGITVFGLYEYLILHRVNEGSDVTKTQKVFVDVPRRVDEPAPQTLSAQMSVHPPTSGAHLLLPLSYHMAAGALVGAVQSAVLDFWEITSYWVHRQRYRHLHDGHAPDIVSLVNTPLVIRRLVHHSLGYMTLFGTYEFMRRQGQEQVRNVLQSGQPWVVNQLDWLLEQGFIGTRKSTYDNNQEMYDLTNVPLLVSFGAGGIAGQAHYTVSHYLKQFRKASDHAHHKIRHPAMSTICMAFFPTAISFMAFQFGGELTERILAVQEME